LFLIFQKNANITGYWIVLSNRVNFETFEQAYEEFRRSGSDFPYRDFLALAIEPPGKKNPVPSTARGPMKPKRHGDEPLIDIIVII